MNIFELVVHFVDFSVALNMRLVRKSWTFKNYHYLKHITFTSVKIEEYVQAFVTQQLTLHPLSVNFFIKDMISCDNFSGILWSNIKSLKLQQKDRVSSINRKCYSQTVKQIFKSCYKNNVPVHHIQKMIDSPEFKNLHYLNLNGIKIPSIKGLEKCVNLQILKLRKTEIFNLGPISNLTSLHTLDVSTTFVEDIPQLYATKVNFSNTGVTDLSHLTNIIHLNVSYCNRININQLAKLTQLETLIFNCFYIEDASFLKQMTRLSTLELDGSRIKDFDVGEDLKSLIPFDKMCTQSTCINLSPHSHIHSLRLSNNSISNFHALRFIRHLNLSGTHITDASLFGDVYELKLDYCSRLINISRLSNVHFLSLSFCPIKDITPLSVRECKYENCSYRISQKLHTHISYLNLNWTAVSDVNCLSGVQYLQLMGTMVTDVSALSEVKRLNLSRTHISDISPLTKVEVLDISYTKVKDISHLKSVKFLDVGCSEVKDVSGLNAKILNFSK